MGRESYSHLQRSSNAPVSVIKDITDRCVFVIQEPVYMKLYDQKKEKQLSNLKNWITLLLAAISITLFIAVHLQ
jgi:hypothetical protein